MKPGTNRSKEAGSIMPMATIFVAFLMIGAWALVSASQQWGARRQAHAVAASAARAGAQGDFSQLRNGGVIDPQRSVERAQAILDAAGARGAVQVNGATVSVTVWEAVDYAFPAPGFPAEVRGDATAVAVRGVDQPESE